MFSWSGDIAQLNGGVLLYFFDSCITVELVTQWCIVYVVIRVIFLLAVNACNKKIVTSYMHYCKKKKITRLDDFFVHDLPQK